MALYQVTLRNIKQPELARSVEIQAASREQAASMAHREGFRVAMVKPASAGARKASGEKSISKKEQIKLFRGLASMLKANISTSDALMYYAQGLPNESIKANLNNIRERLAGGMPAHLAFAKEGKFDITIITVIEAGADAGQLHSAFSSLAARIKIEMTFASKLRTALTLPCIVILFQIALFIWSQTGVVRKVEETLQSVRQEPDPISHAIFAVSHVVQAVWPFFVIGLGSFLVAIFRSAPFRQKLLLILMKRWSLASKLVRGLRQSAYIGTLEMLYRNGINLARASMLSARVVSGTPMYDQFVKASKVYESSGTTFAESLKRHTDLDPQVVHMVGIGEKFASLPQQLELLKEIYDEDTNAYMNDFTQAINFITLALAVFIIGIVFTGAMLPIFMMGPRMMNSGNM